MSRLYIQRLRAVRGEFEAARQGVTDVTPNDFRRAGDYAFATYIIRLSAEVEGILKAHLLSNHPSVSVPKDAKLDWLISQVTKAEGFTIDATLRRNMDRVRTYRNNFAHSGTLPVAVLTFASALS